MVEWDMKEGGGDERWEVRRVTARGAGAFGGALVGGRGWVWGGGGGVMPGAAIFCMIGTTATASRSSSSSSRRRRRRRLSCSHRPMIGSHISASCAARAKRLKAINRNTLSALFHALHTTAFRSLFFADGHRPHLPGLPLRRAPRACEPLSALFHCETCALFAVRRA
jgi:hypothetical protein